MATRPGTRQAGPGLPCRFSPKQLERVQTNQHDIHASQQNKEHLAPYNLRAPNEHAPSARPFSGTATLYLAKFNVPKPPERKQVPPPALQGPRRPPPLQQERGHPPLTQRLPREEAAEGPLDGASRRSSHPVGTGRSCVRQRVRSALRLRLLC